MAQVSEDRNSFYQVLTRKITVLIVIVSFFSHAADHGYSFFPI